METGVRERSIIITGGAAGIGLATAKRLSADGWRVGLIDLSEDSLAEIKNQLGDTRVAVATADVSDAGSLSDAIDQLVEELNGIDAIFNNAGILRDGPFTEVALADHHLTIAVNAAGVINGCHLAIPHLEKRSGVKHIINMSSASTIHGIGGLSVYSATKAFVEHLSEALDIELSRSNIKLSTIAVPFVQTAMIDAESDQMKGYVKEQKQPIIPEDVANRVAAILDGSASGRMHQLISPQLKFQHLLRRILPTSTMHNIAKRAFEKTGAAI